MERLVGFSEAEAKYFGNIVREMMKAKEGRRKVKKEKKEKKPAKMKRGELLKRLLEFLGHGVLTITVGQEAEWLLLREELKKVVK